jgi:hypothetical protein
MSIEDFLTDPITEIEVSRNGFGDIVYGAQATIMCRFREINSLTRSVDGREELDCDALVHFAKTQTVEMGDVFCYGGIYYRVDVINKARKFGDLQFVKCGLVIMRQVS